MWRLSIRSVKEGYSRLMGEDDEATIRTLTAYRRAMTALIEQHHGRVVDSPGDNMLAEFASAVNAVQGAVAIQKELKAKNSELPPNRKMEFRIGVNIGDVVVEDGRLYGDGVNIAARLESLAEAGGICISGKVFEEVEVKLPLGYKYVGEQQVKNIAKPVPVYQIQLELETATEQTEGLGQSALRPAEGTLTPRRWPIAVLAVVGLLVVGGGVMLFRNFSPHSSPRSARVPFEGTPSLALPDKPSIAVLPFINMSSDPEQEYFSDGMTDTLITDLSRLSALFVIARNSVFTYKGKAVKLEEVGRELGVQYVLEGSVQKAGDRVRINTQLIDTTTGGHVWAKRYDGNLQDLLVLQDEITQKIVLALKVKLTLDEQERFRRYPTENLTAYDYHLRGLESLYRFTRQANTQAQQLFESAIELDPGYAAAYAALGWTYYIEWVFQWSQDPQTLEWALEMAQRAVSLDDSLPMAHMVLGAVYLRQGRHEQAIGEGEKAIALDLNYADAYVALADALNLSGQPEKAVEIMEKAMRLNPHYQALYVHELGWAYRLTGRYEEAIAAYKRALRLNPNLLSSHIDLAVVYSELGREKEARAAVGEVLRLSPNFSLEIARQTCPYKDQAILERKLAALRKAGLK